MLELTAGPVVAGCGRHRPALDIAAGINNGDQGRTARRLMMLGTPSFREEFRRLAGVASLTRLDELP